MQRVRVLLAGATPQRALLEAVLLSVVLWGFLSLFHTHLTIFYTRIGPLSFIGLLCICVFVLRVRVPPALSFRQFCLDSLAGIFTCLLLSLVEAVFSYALFSQPSAPRFGMPLSVALVALDFILNCTIGFFGRIAVRFLMVWNRLRRRHLFWELTHAHIMMLTLVAGIIIFAIDSLLLILTNSHNQSSDGLLVVLPVTLFLIIISVVVMVIVVSPIALFSYFVLRKTTRRLETLTNATSALRQKEYAVRVPVDGEDEVAQLQSDFNAMATDLERSMKALQEERDRVSALLQERRELIANVSHELRTPVATLRGYLETTLMHWEHVSRTNLNHDLRIMEDEVIHLQARVEDLFTLARADVGRLTLKLEPVHVGELVQRIVSVRAPLAWRSSRIEVVAEVPEDLPLVLADARRLEQALQNLLHNGLRHTAPGGIVAVMVVVESTTVAIHVRDTGEGIAAKDLPHIWERFYQTESARSRMGGGTGLGLALVKEWIEGMGGTVAVESTRGEGSCFTLCMLRYAGVEMPQYITQKSLEML